MVFTVVFLSLLTNLREKREWKDVETWVKRRMGKQLYSLFDILARFIYPEQFKPRPSKEELLRILEDLNEMKGATLNENAIYYYFPKPSDDLSAHQLDVLFTFRKYLSDLEIKYFRFIKPEIRISLMEIQNNLDSIESLFNLVKRFESSEEVVKNSMAEPILAIMKEIYKLHKMGMEVYPEQESRMTNIEGESSKKAHVLEQLLPLLTGCILAYGLREVLDPWSYKYASTTVKLLHFLVFPTILIIFVYLSFIRLGEISSYRKGRALFLGASIVSLLLAGHFYLLER